MRPYSRAIRHFRVIISYLRRILAFKVKWCDGIGAVFMKAMFHHFILAAITPSCYPPPELDLWLKR